MDDTCKPRPSVTVELQALGDDLDRLAAPLLAWITEATPVLRRYRDQTLNLEESAADPSWIDELPAGARVMGLALGVAALLEEAAGTGEPGAEGWDYVRHLLGPGPAAALRSCRWPPGRAEPAVAAVEVIDPPRPPVTPDTFGLRLAELERRQETLASLLENLTIVLGAETPGHHAA